MPAYCHPAVSFWRPVRWFFPLRHFVLLRRVFIGESWLAQYNWTDASWCCRLQACGLLLVSRSETFFESTFDKFFTFCLFLYCAEGKMTDQGPEYSPFFAVMGASAAMVFSGNYQYCHNLHWSSLLNWRKSKWVFHPFFYYFNGPELSTVVYMWKLTSSASHANVDVAMPAVSDIILVGQSELAHFCHCILFRVSFRQRSLSPFCVSTENKRLFPIWLAS